MINLAVIAGITLISHIVALLVSFAGLKIFFDLFFRSRQRTPSRVKPLKARG